MKITEKMLSMVDFDAFFESVKVTSELPADKINKEVVKSYLEDWAKAKQDIFVLFGEKLTIEKPVEIPPSKSTTRCFVETLKKRWPAYAAQISAFTMEEYMSNEILGLYEEDEKERDYLSMFFGKVYRRGAKVSKVLSKTLQDEQFDIELSKHLQNRVVNGRAVLSIHPMDYVTMSTNYHKWNSCMHIIDGFNKFGGYSLMLDKSTIIAYNDTGDDVDYENKAGHFKWNNKIFRQIISVSIKHKIFHLGHYNGTVSEGVRKIWVETMQELLGEHYWVSTGNNYNYGTKDGEFYYDTLIYDTYYPKGKKYERPHFGVEKLKCVRCGKEFSRLVGYKGWLTCNKH